MNEIHCSVVDGDLAVKRTYGTGSKGESQFAQRITDCNNAVTDLHVVRITQHNRCETVCADLQHRDIIALVIADQLSFVGFIVICGDFDLVRIFDHMVVGNDISV